MNRKNLDNVRFVDLDEFVLMEIVPIQFPDDGKVLRDGFRVDGVSRNGLRIEGLYVDRQSGQDKLCQKFIADNWVNKK
jgi:hypothetical protein